MIPVEYEELDGTDVKIPKVGLGTYQIEAAPKEEAIAALRRGIELGMTLIDTAEMYGWGKAEELVGEAIKPFDRESLTIVTKVWGTNLAYESVGRAARASAARLGTYIDIYLIHWPNPSYPLEETLRAMEELVSEGIVRYIGVSNFSLDLLKRARELLEHNDVVTNQVEYSLRVREPEEDLLPYCQRERITLMAYSPLDRGRLAKRPPQKLKVIAAR
ncbi:MAG: aldo/keto reductase, partial [Candidatus Korarchaeota archaeon]|nr:aldo/keto reductase [Candidatus Korarchaeota archaeon]